MPNDASNFEILDLPEEMSAPKEKNTASEERADSQQAETQDTSEYGALTQEEMAAEIAKAVAGSIASEEKTAERAAPRTGSAGARETAARQPAAPTRPAVPRPAPRTEAAPPMQSAPEPDIQPGPAVRNPGTVQTKIPKSHVHVGFGEILGNTIGDIRERQRKDLPGSGTSLKATEKHQTLLSRTCGLFSPFRYVILILMVLALAGRQYDRLLPGILGGETGMVLAMALTLLAIVCSWHVLVCAVRDMFYLRFSFESLLLVTTILSLADTALTGDTETLLPLLAIGWCLCGTADVMAIRGKQYALRTMIAGKVRTGVRVARNKWEHTDCIGKAPASTAGFVRRLEERDTWHAGWTVWGFLLLVAALIVSAYLTARTEGNYLHILVTLLTVSLPVAGTLCCVRPFELLSRAMGRGAAVSGWSGMKFLSGKKAVLIYDRDLFPAGTITHKGVRVYGNQTPQLLVSYGASLVLRADNGLSEPFTKLLQETGGEICSVSHFQATEGGLTGRINGVFVAVGTYNFMQLMGMLPPETGSRGGLFIALGGEIAGLFAIKYRVKKGAAGALHRLVRQSSLTPLVVTRNLCVNPAFVEHWFKVPVGDMVCPKAGTRRTLSEPSQMARGTVCGYVLTDGIIPYSRLVAGSRKGFRAGRWITGISILLSAVLFVLTAWQIAGGTAITDCVRLMLIQLILWLVTEISARVSAR